MKRCILCLILCLTLALQCGCSQGPDSSAAVPGTDSGTTEPTASGQLPSEPVTTEVPETQPENSTAPNAISQLHSGILPDGTFTSGTLFVGDSLTYGLVLKYLQPNHLLGEARFITVPSAATAFYFYGRPLDDTQYPYPGYSQEFYNMRMFEAVEAAGEEVTAIYFMMGTNQTESSSLEIYISIVEHMLQSCPNATVFLELVPFDDSPKVSYEQATQWILEAYDYFQQQGITRVQLIDTQSAIGYNLIHDGIHLSEEGQVLWYQALVAYAAQHGLQP